MIHSVTVIRSAIDEVVSESATAEIESATLTAAFVLVALAWALRRNHRLDRRITMVAATGFALALATLVVAERADGWLTMLDGPVTRWLTGHRTPVVTDVALTVTAASGPPETAALAAVVAAVMLWRTRRIIAPLVLLSTVCTATIACIVLEVVVGRDRPPVSLRLVVEAGRSFPSGHVTGTATMTMMTALVVGAHVSAPLRALLAIAASVVVTLVAANGLYLGIDWLTDTVAGVLLAAMTVTLGSTIMHVAQSRPTAGGGGRIAASAAGG